MSSLQLRKASRKQAKLRVGLSGSSGSGKTYSALLIAKGLASSWDKIAVIDSENGSGELYSDLGEYNTIDLKAPFSPERYIEAIEACEKAGMEVVIIDSASHEWEGKGGCLEINELLANSKFKGNTWAAWSETTPRHQKFIQTILQSPCHIITTARSKTDMIQTENKKIKKVGTKEIQREGFEYELTVNFNIDREGHYAIASKDRTKLFIDRDPFVISEETGKELLDWNSGGAVNYDFLKNAIWNQFKVLEIEMPPEKHEVKPYILKITPELTGKEFAEENYEEILEALKQLTPETAAVVLKPAKDPEEEEGAAEKEGGEDNPL